MKIEKRPSGNYRIRSTVKGKTYSVTLPFKPTQREAYDIIQEKINGSYVDKSLTFSDAVNQFFKIKSNVFSASTQRGYDSMYRNMDDGFKKLRLLEIDNIKLQTLINDYALEHSPKSTSNLYGFVLSVIKTFYPDIRFSINLPQKQPRKAYMPTITDVQALLAEAKDTEYYIPIYLACLGLRNSEACALTIEDLDANDQVTISKALIRGKNGYVLKPCPKNDTSYRTITIPHDLADLVREKGYFYQGYPQQPDKYIRRTLKKLGIPHFSIHSLRHFFVAYGHSLGYSDAVLQSLGGWSPKSNTMQSVYRYVLNQENAQKQIAKDFKF